MVGPTLLNVWGMSEKCDVLGLHVLHVFKKKFFKMSPQNFFLKKVLIF